MSDCIVMKSLIYSLEHKTLNVFWLAEIVTSHSSLSFRVNNGLVPGNVLPLFWMGHDVRKWITWSPSHIIQQWFNYLATSSFYGCFYHFSANSQGVYDYTFLRSWGNCMFPSTAPTDKCYSPKHKAVIMHTVLAFLSLFSFCLQCFHGSSSLV